MVEGMFISIFIFLMVAGLFNLIALIKNSQVNASIDDSSVNTFRSLDFYIEELIKIAHQRAHAESINDSVVRMLAVKKCDERLIFTSKAIQSKFPEVSGL